MVVVWEASWLLVLAFGVFFVCIDGVLLSSALEKAGGAECKKMHGTHAVAHACDGHGSGAGRGHARATPYIADGSMFLCLCGQQLLLNLLKQAERAPTGFGMHACMHLRGMVDAICIS